MHQPKNSDCELIDGKFMHTVNSRVCTYLVKPCDRCWPPIGHSRSRNDLRPIRRDETSIRMNSWQIAHGEQSSLQLLRITRSRKPCDRCWPPIGHSRNESAQRIAHNFCAQSQSPIARMNSWQIASNIPGARRALSPGLEKFGGRFSRPN